MVRMRVAFHEDGENHESNENAEDKELSVGFEEPRSR